MHNQYTIAVYTQTAVRSETFGVLLLLTTRCNFDEHIKNKPRRITQTALRYVTFQQTCVTARGSINFRPSHAIQRCRANQAESEQSWAIRNFDQIGVQNGFVRQLQQLSINYNGCVWAIVYRCGNLFIIISNQLKLLNVSQCQPKMHSAHIFSRVMYVDDRQKP